MLPSSSVQPPSKLFSQRQRAGAHDLSQEGRQSVKASVKTAEMAAKLSLSTKLIYALPRLACSLFSLHVSSKARKYYTDGEHTAAGGTAILAIRAPRTAVVFCLMVGY